MSNECAGAIVKLLSRGRLGEGIGVGGGVEILELGRLLGGNGMALLRVVEDLLALLRRGTGVVVGIEDVVVVERVVEADEGISIAWVLEKFHQTLVDFLPAPEVGLGCRICKAAAPGASAAAGGAGAARAGARTGAGLGAAEAREVWRLEERHLRPLLCVEHLGSWFEAFEMSFRKRNVVVAQPGESSTAGRDESKKAPSVTPGVRPSPLDGRLTTSTGTKSLDALLAGHAGLALGTSLLVEESGTTDFGAALLRYYAAEGVVQGHNVHVLGMNEAWARDLPGLAAGDGLEKKEEMKSSEERMKIAWRYERLGEFGSSRGAHSLFHFCFMIPYSIFTRSNSIPETNPSIRQEHPAVAVCFPGPVDILPRL